MTVVIPVENSIFGKKVRLDVVAEESVGKVIDFANNLNSFANAEEMELAENNIIEHYYNIIGGIDDHILPFWWEDFISVETELKALVSLFVIFVNKIKFIKNRMPFDNLMEKEILFLEKVKKYFSEIISSTKSSKIAFSKEMAADAKNLQKDFMESLKNKEQYSGDDENALLMVFGVFEKINRVNDKIINSINKINLGAAV